MEKYVGGSYAGCFVCRCTVDVEICVLLITAKEISTPRRTRGPDCGWYPLSLGVGLCQQTRGPDCGWYPLPFTATFLLRQAHITSVPRDTLPYIIMMRQLNQPVHHITSPKITSLRPLPPPSSPYLAYQHSPINNLTILLTWQLLAVMLALEQQVLVGNYT